MTTTQANPNPTAIQPSPSLRQRSRSLRGFCLRLIIALRYRLEIVGLSDIPTDRPLLFLPNHPSLLDPLLVYSCLDGLRPRFLADENQFSSALLRWVKNTTQTITIPDYNLGGPSARAGVLQGLEEAAAALNSGASILLFPAGAMQREMQEKIRNTSSVSRILQAAPSARVIGVRIEGMWGSSFSRANNPSERPDFMAMLTQGVKAVLGNLIFFTPRRPVRISFIEASAMPRPEQGESFANASARKAINDWLNNFYAGAQHEAIKVPYSMWQKAFAQK